MITPHESTAYRPPLAHSTTNPDHQWTRQAPSAAVPIPREPVTSARGAPSLFRHHPTGSQSSSSSTNQTISQTPIAPVLFDNAAQSSSSSSSSSSNHHQPTRSISTSSTSSSNSSSTVAVSDTPQKPSPSRTKRASEDSAPIKLRNISHVKQLYKDENAYQPTRRNRSGYEDRQRYEISNMPVGDVIEMVASLLTKITTTNDRQNEHGTRSIAPEAAMGFGGTANSVLAFHGKNVPSITIMSYLSRIHKYCPTTYEVFLSLLVYFDRMTERVNSNTRGPPAGSGSVSRGESPSLPEKSSTSSLPDTYGSLGSHVFVVDSFNIHRLVIAGVTCASKFFSDIFYTNSRYAKVGGLPLTELNHLELQFLILNDFRLSVPVEELEAYGTMLVQYYAREAVANANFQQPMPIPNTQHAQSREQQTYVEAGRVGAAPA